LYTSDRTPLPNIPGLGFYRTYKGIYGPGNRWWRGLRFAFGSAAVLLRAISSGETICHFHFFHGSITELASVLIATLCKRRIVITVHDVETFEQTNRSNSFLIGKIYTLAEKIIVHNQISRRELIHKLNIPASNISVIPHGNYLDSISAPPSPATAKHDLGIEPAMKVILFFGQIKNVKGLDILISAMPEVIDKVPDVMLLIAGRPWKSDFSGYEDLIDRLNIRHKCVLHIRFIPDDQVSLYYGAADVVVLPYRRIYQSGVVLLTMSYQKPAIVSDLEGMTEIITDRDNGYVFPEGSVADLAETLIRVLQDKPGRDAVAQSAFEYVKKHHNWKQIGEATAEVYRALLFPQHGQ
jgi:D-inositol-3-phosphate glycosyltransferase